MSSGDDIARHFLLTSEVKEVCPYGAGHINDTFLVQAEGGTRYVLQRINTAVFRYPGALMANFGLVTRHVRARLSEMGVGDLDRRCLRVIPTREGRDFFQDEAGGAWRMISFIPGTYSADFVSGPNQAYEAARAFGIFQRCLWDLDPGRVTDVIPGFHDIGGRFAQLREAIAEGLPERLSLAEAEVEKAISYEPLVTPLLEAWKSGSLPRRVTHNDTKLNNVLLDTQSGEGLCVIDLDTVMAGTVLFDFGDMVRTFTSPVAEDDPGLSKVRCRMEVFEALSEGYLGALQGCLTRGETEGLPLSGVYMTLIMAIRFLADFLRGDVYYKTHRPGHNLDRCRNQLALIADLLSHRAEMERRVSRLVGE